MHVSRSGRCSRLLLLTFLLSREMMGLHEHGNRTPEDSSCLAATLRSAPSELRRRGQLKGHKRPPTDLRQRVEGVLSVFLGSIFVRVLRIPLANRRASGGSTNSSPRSGIRVPVAERPWNGLTGRRH